ncbi:4-hydroxyphenylpyruvate dioxygenase [Wenjunlia vitaminophila]|uniref:4-hydroxyphenylpyruvate dioxygenase n=1 Tax=Wenjunlia vitaminophila TaxID=76728 RepID=A0A0T6LUM3_WENVI|nr:4-hydroxyphenylpyruvate dioxygenase [Wenjunlia vitaminophila]
MSSRPGPAAEAPRTGAAGEEGSEFALLGIDHLRLCVGNAWQAAHFYVSALGMTPLAWRGPGAGGREHGEYLLASGQVRFLVTGGAEPDSAAGRWAARHGDGVSDVAFAVRDVDAAFAYAVARGATGLVEPHTVADDRGGVRTAALAGYGPVRHTLVDRSGYGGAFLPGFHPLPGRSPRRELFHTVDHVVGCVERGRMDHWVDFYRRTMGFTPTVEFVGDDIATEYSGLMSKVLTDGTGRIRLPLNEPAPGRRRSQIEEYLHYHQGPGIQHVALETDDIVAATDAMRAAGVEFLATPDTYYQDPALRARIGPVRVDLADLNDRGILVDRDEDGYLLQIFTRPLSDRPTFFVELIERHGSRGFGKGNFQALFEAVEREQARRGNL